jgi:hypothetical protein
MILWKLYRKRLYRKAGKWVWDTKRYYQGDPHPANANDSIMAPFSIELVEVQEDYCV